MTTASKGTVPPMRVGVVGEKYGGAYWDRAEYEVVVGFTDNGNFVISLNDESGCAIDEVEFDRDTAWELWRYCRSITPIPGPPKLPGLEQTTVWILADAVHTATFDDFDQLADWLEYALNIKTWDYDEQGEEWEY